MVNDAKSSPKIVNLDQIEITSGFWESKQSVNRHRTIPTIYHQLEKTGRLDIWDLDAAKDQRKKGQIVHMFWDSDTAKWIEAVGYSLHKHPDAELEKQTDALIERIQKAQQADGYLNTYFTTLEPEKRWTNLRDCHEMYNAGHLVEGAVAYYHATGKRTMLDVLSRYVDHISSIFGAEDGKKHGYPGHPELEMALVKLYKATSEKRFLDLSQYFIEERGKEPYYFDIEAIERGDDPKNFWAQTYRYCQAHEPIREQKTATGHAVRACYLYAAVADIALETGDKSLVDLSRRLWDDLTETQMYITGGLGPAHSNEGFTFAYDLPNETAYAETCAAISLVFWAQRMFQIDPHSRYIDVMERALYNGVLSGVSLEGEHFFYANPLTAYPNINPTEHFSGITSAEHYRRSEWFYCPCCPPNIARTVANIGTYFYSSTDTRLYVHLYNPSKTQFTFAGKTLELSQETNYPWDGSIQFTINTATNPSFELALRIPDWCGSYELSVNGQIHKAELENGHHIIKREWQNNDKISLNLAMPVERVMPHPQIRQNAGQIALQRGPLIYCIEEVDNGAALAQVVLPKNAEFRAEFHPELLGGVVVIEAEATRPTPSNWQTGLYQLESRLNTATNPFQLKAIPYFLWANREPGEMRVWIREA